MRLIIFLSVVIVLCSQCNLFNKAANPIEFVSSENIVIPQDRESVNIGTEETTYADAELCKGNIFGDWLILTVFNKEAKGEETPFLNFVKYTGNLYGNNGCNAINGSYTYNLADSTISFSNVITTMRNCNQSDITDFDINTALSMISRYNWSFDGIDNYLSLYDANGVLLMTLMHRNFNFLNGSWSVIKINDEAQNNPDLKLVFDIDEQKLHGNTGCNVINGNIEIDMYTTNSISFQQIVSTLKSCPNIEGETNLLVALEDVMHLEPIDKDRVKLLDSSNNPVLELRRID